VTEGGLAPGEVAEYSFSLGGVETSLRIFDNGSSDFYTLSSNPFGALKVGETAVFNFTYTNQDATGVISDPASVTVTIIGDSDPPLAIDDFDEVQVLQTGEIGEVDYLVAAAPNLERASGTFNVAHGNILANDTDPDGSFAAGDFSIVSIEGETFNNPNGVWWFNIADVAGGNEGQISGWQLNLESGGMAYTFSKFSTLEISDFTTSSSQITVSGVTGTLSHVSLTLFGFEHSFFHDLVGTLTASNGQTIEFFNSTGGGFAADGDVTFDDNALVNISNAENPITGTFTTQSGTALNDFVSSFPTTMVVGGDYGTLIIHQDGSYDYILDANNGNVRELPAGGSLQENFSYTMQDETGLTSSATLHIDIALENQPPVAEPNHYVVQEFDVDSQIASEAGFKVGNLITDANPVDNAVDSDPEGGPLLIGSITFPTLQVNNQDVPLVYSPSSDPLIFANFTINYEGSEAVLSISRSGDVTLHSSDSNFFTFLNDDTPQAIFNFNYTVVDNHGLESPNEANVSFTVEHPQVFSTSDTLIIPENLVVGSEVDLMNVVTSDFSTLGLPITMALATDPKLTINGVDYDLTGTTPDGTFFAMYSFSYNGEVSSFKIMSDGEVIFLPANGAEVFGSLEQGQEATFSFSYRSTDGVATSSVDQIGVATVNITGTSPTSNGNEYDLSVTELQQDVNQVDEGIYQKVIGNILTDVEDLSLPYDPDDNPVDVDPNASTPLNLLVHSISDVSLTIGENLVTLTSVPDGSLSQEELAAYTFTFLDEDYTLVIEKDGTVSLEGSSADLLSGLGKGETARFDFSYTNINAFDKPSLSPAEVTITVQGENYPPAVEAIHYSDTVEIVAQKSVALEPAPYLQFNPFAFPITQEGVNISTILQGSTNPQIDNINDFLVNNITLEADEPNLGITFIEEGAGNKSTLGWYKIDDNGHITDVNIIWPNVSAQGSGGDLQPGISTQSLGDLQQGDHIGFFLVGNGFNKNLSGNTTQWDNLLSEIQAGHGHLAFKVGNSTSSDASVTDSSPHLWYIKTDPASTINTFEIISSTNDSKGIFHSEASPNSFSLNGDNLQHVIGSLIPSGVGEANLQIGFEDLSNGGDKDYNDTVFHLQLHTPSTNYEQATSSHLNMYFTDPDGTKLSKAIIGIEEGGVQGDRLTLQGFSLSSTADGDGFYAITTSGYTGLSIKGLNTDLTIGSNQIEIRGLDTHEHYQDVVDALHLQNNLFYTDPDQAAGTREFGVIVFDEHGTQSEAEIAPFIVTQLTAENVFLGTDGNDYLHLHTPVEGTGEIEGDPIMDLPAVEYYGGLGDDIIKDENNESQIHGEEGNDLLIGQGGNDVLKAGVNYHFTYQEATGGGLPTFTVTGIGTNTVVLEGEGPNQSTVENLIFGSTIYHLVQGTQEDDTVGTTGGLVGSEKNDLYLGFEGDNDFLASAGKDVMALGETSQTDTVMFDMAHKNSLPGETLILNFDRTNDVLVFQGVTGADLSALDTKLSSVINGGTGQDLTFEFTGGGAVTLHGLGSASSITNFTDFESLYPGTQVHIFG
jgi:VCBS repeat-containing protein